VCAHGRHGITHIRWYITLLFSTECHAALIKTVRDLKCASTTMKIFAYDLDSLTTASCPRWARRRFMARPPFRLRTARHGPHKALCRGVACRLVGCGSAARSQGEVYVNDWKASEKQLAKAPLDPG
jgi:hypothetical protein